VERDSADCEYQEVRINRGTSWELAIRSSKQICKLDSPMLGFCHCDKISEKINLKEERFILAYSFTP
jgi:hypothetical protein